MKKQVQ